MGRKFEPKTKDFILRRMVNKVVARTELNDLNDGSDLKQVLAASAREDDDQYVQMINLQDLLDLFRCTGQDLDDRAAQFNPRLIQRVKALRASGAVVFSRGGTVGAITIPIGTQVTVPAAGDSPEIVFTTTSEGTIGNGSQTSGSVGIVAEEKGIVGNVAGGAIKGFISKPPGVDAVTNPSPLVNGLDKQRDEDFLRAIITQIKGLGGGHNTGLIAAAERVEDVTTGKKVKFAHVIEDIVNLGRSTLYVDDGTGTIETSTTQAGATVLASAVGGETVLYLPNKPVKIESAFTLLRNATPLVQGTDYTLNPASGQINLLAAAFPAGLTAADAITVNYTFFTGLIALVQKVIDGDPANRVQFPGVRASGILVRVLSPQIAQQIVSCRLSVLANFDRDSVIAEVRAAILAYVNSLTISEDVILNELRERVMDVPGVYDVEFYAPLENIVILDNQLPRLIANNLSVT